MPSFSIALASARMPSPEAFSERKSSSMMTMGKRNFMRAFGEGKRKWGALCARSRRMWGRRAETEPKPARKYCVGATDRRAAAKFPDRLHVRDDDRRRPADQPQAERRAQAP